MSTNTFMPPALPQTPAPDLNSAPGKSPAALKSRRLGNGADQGQSFANTLNRISDRDRRCNLDSNAAKKPALRAGGQDTEPGKPEKRCNRKAVAEDHLEENEAQRSPVSGNESRPVHPWLAFGLLPAHLTSGLGADDSSLAVETPSDANAGLKRMLIDWIAHLQSQGQNAHGERVGIGPFEQLQASIEPEALNRFFFKQLAAGDIQQLDNGNLMGKTVPGGNLVGQPESFGASGDELLHMLKMSGALWGLNADTGGSGGPKMAVGLEGAYLNADHILKMASGAQTAESGRFENAKMALAGSEGRAPFWASSDSNSEILWEAQGRRQNGDSQALKNQAALQQPANPNTAPAAAAAKVPDEVFSMKNPVSKSEMQPIQTLGNKISHVDGDSKDSSFLFSQDQMSQHLSRLENTAQRSEAAQRGLMSSTLNQIVQKAVHSLNNGQHEVRIDLKPDFLGHIRMQIVSESQQVAVRIVAELPLVKEMLENNLNQLKTELQAQGLKVDELEVSVAHDSRKDDDRHQKAAELSRARNMRNSRNSVDAAAEEQAAKPIGRFDRITETAIDFFA